MQSEYVFTEAPFDACHAPTIALYEAELIAAWFAGTGEGAADTEIWVARRTSAGWESPARITQTRFACWNPVLFVANDELLLFYRCGPSPSQWGSFWLRSPDGGRTFGGEGAPGVHVDHHAIWINPNDSDHIILGSDGGVSRSYDRGESWRKYNNMSLGQFYRIGVDTSDVRSRFEKRNQGRLRQERDPCPPLDRKWCPFCTTL